MDHQLQRRANRNTAPGALLHPVTAALLACAVVTALFTAGFLAQQYGSEEPATASLAVAPTTPAPPPPPSSSPAPGIGEPVRDGSFEFVVSRMSCSRSTVGIEHLKRTAKGRYCVISLSVRNIAAEESMYFLGHAQKAFDANGESYRYDEIASIYADQNVKTFVHKLGAGDRVKIKLVFDIPRTTTLTHLELHDSLLSGGAEITLG